MHIYISLTKVKCIKSIKIKILGPIILSTAVGGNCQRFIYSLAYTEFEGSLIIHCHILFYFLSSCVLKKKKKNCLSFHFSAVQQPASVDKAKPRQAWKSLKPFVSSGPSQAMVELQVTRRLGRLLCPQRCPLGSWGRLSMGQHNFPRLTTFTAEQGA